MREARPIPVVAPGTLRSVRWSPLDKSLTKPMAPIANKSAGRSMAVAHLMILPTRRDPLRSDRDAKLCQFRWHSLRRKRPSAGRRTNWTVQIGPLSCESKVRCIMSVGFSTEKLAPILFELRTKSRSGGLMSGNAWQFDGCGDTPTARERT